MIQAFIDLRNRALVLFWAVAILFFLAFLILCFGFFFINFP